MRKEADFETVFKDPNDEAESDKTMDSAGVDFKGPRMRLFKNHGKRRIQICFRVTENAYDRLMEVARLFELKESEYVKAVLYKDLGAYNERIDHRRKPWRQRQERKEQE